MGAFATNLRSELSHHGLTQENFAREIGVTHRAVQKWVSGRAVPHAAQLIAIAQFFDRSVESFFDEPERSAA